MASLLILILGVVYIALALWIIFKMKTPRRKLIALLILALLPTADAVYGRIKLKRLCKSEGGVHVYAVVQGVDGFYYGLGAGERWLTTYGFWFIEGDALGKNTTV